MPRPSGAEPEVGGGAPPATGISLAEARAILDRAIERASGFGQSGTVAVTDPAGNLVSLSRMDGAAASSVPTARAKAALAAATCGPTGGFSMRMDAHPLRYLAYRDLLRQATFPGPGGAPILRGARVVGGYASSGIVPLRSIPGIPADRFLAGSVHGNTEDLVTAYALQTPYLDQHDEP